jgi:hypothetical protein
MIFFLGQTPGEIWGVHQGKLLYILKLSLLVTSFKQKLDLTNVIIL